jgi:hypothetical protein
MPQPPFDPLDRLGKAGTSLAIFSRGVGPTHGWLGSVLDSHRQVKPVQHMPSRTDARRFTKRAWSFCTVAQDRDERPRRRSKTTQHAAQLVPLPISLRRHTAEYGLLPIVIADLGKHHLERPNLTTANRAHGAAVCEQRDGLSFGRRRSGLVDAACCSSRAPTRMVRRRIVSTAGTSPRGRNSANSVLARTCGRPAA